MIIIRFLTLNDLNLNDMPEIKNKFYQKMIDSIQLYLSQDNSHYFDKPEKKYEIFKINIDNGLYALMKTDNLYPNEESNLYFDPHIAYEIYKRLVDIDESIKAEDFESSELYLSEKITKENEIIELTKKDNLLYNNQIEKYNSFINSDFYKQYVILKENYKKLENENISLKKELQLCKEKEISKSNNLPKKTNSFIEKLFSKFNKK